MSRISRQLKKQADFVLPDEKVKEQIKDRLGISAKARRNISFSKFAAIGAVLLVFALTAAAIGIFGGDRTGGKNDNGGDMQGGGGIFNPVSETYISISINPAFEITADTNDKVTSVTGLNSDARLVMLGKSYTGKPVLDVCEDIVKTAIHLGYVNEENLDINIVAANADNDKENSTISGLQSVISSLISAEYTNAVLAVSNEETARNELIAALSGMFGSNPDKYQQATVKELVRLLNSYDITREEELDALEEEWERLLENEGYDDDIAEDIIDEWKESTLKPLAGDFEDKLDDYIDVYELFRMGEGNSEDKAESLAEAEEQRLKTEYLYNPAYATPYEARRALCAELDRLWEKKVLPAYLDVYCGRMSQAGNGQDEALKQEEEKRIREMSQYKMRDYIEEQLERWFDPDDD
ncbi:MAG TPA: hypothetical protein IAC70_00830 [Candidatus Faecicola pullistercoris]|nr:hypothetical protein [Candidatus Faecicola pullistercoris]